MSGPAAIGFLGAGQMATALARGWAAAGLLDVTRSLASDPYPPAREKFAEATGVRAVEGNAEVLVGCEVVVLAVKPQAMAGLLDEVSPWVEPRHLFVSIAAGVTLKQLAEAIGDALQLPVRSTSREEIEAKWGEFLTAFVQFENRASNRKAVEQLGWRPKAVDMLTDIRSGSYQAIAEKLRAETAVR